ncbi:MAG: hypothetical protein ACLFQ8_02910 [Candidatus Aenigmatarchaeota archaeon]
MKEEIRKIINKAGLPVIVEGKRDVEVMKELDVDEIIPLNGRPLYKVAKEVFEGSRKCLFSLILIPKGRR